MDRTKEYLNMNCRLILDGTHEVCEYPDGTTHIKDKDDYRNDVLGRALAETAGEDTVESENGCKTCHLIDACAPYATKFFSSDGKFVSGSIEVHVELPN